MEISIKDYSPKYKRQILNLFEKTFNKKMTKEFWEWRFEKNPYGNPLIKLAFVNQKLVANYLLHPIELRMGFKPIRGLFSMTTMTDPEFAGKGIMSNLAKEVYDLGKRKDYDIIFGFSNKNSRYMFTQKLGFKELETMNEICLGINNNTDFISNCKCIEIENFDEDYSQFYSLEQKRMYKIIIPRTKEHLQWRYTNHPQNKYHCYKITKDNDLKGFFVLKNYEGIKSHIVDYFMINEDIYYEAMIATATSFCKKFKIPELTLWVNNSLPMFKFLLKIGFRKNPIMTFFIAKILNENKIDKTFFDFNNWYVTMGDSDVY